MAWYRWSSALLVAQLVSAPVSAGEAGQPKPNGERWALVIGIDGYDDSLGRLRFAASDAQKLYRCLVTSGGYDRGRTTLLTDQGLTANGQLDPQVRPSYVVLRGRIRAFCEQHENTDTLLVYFAGHGFHSRTSGLDYLAPVDVQRGDLEGTAVSVQWLLELLKRSGARQSAVIVDACRNVVGRGLAAESGPGRTALEAGRRLGVWYLASCGPGERTYEDTAHGGGLYTWAMADALAGAADSNRDGVVTVTEAQRYVRARLEEQTRAYPPVQRPVYSVLDTSGNEMVLSVPTAAAAPTPTPPAAPVVARTPGTPVGSAGRLVVTSVPSEATVLIDGREVGRTPLAWAAPLPPGQRRTVQVGLRLRGYRPLAAEVELVAGATQEWRNARLDLALAAFEWPDYLRRWQPELPTTWHYRVRERDGMPQVLVTSGGFYLGTPDDRGLADEHPRRWVYLDAYWIDVHLVTVAQYRRFCQATGRAMPPEPRWGWQDQHPVVNVTWPEAAAYAQWVEGGLPSEAQWEKAARGGQDNTRYAWGNVWDWCYANGAGRRGQTTPVGEYRPNGFGLFDSAGNALQWCDDAYEPTWYERYYPRNPRHTADTGRRALRGGGWSSTADELRAGRRHSQPPDTRADTIGFRCCNVGSDFGEGSPF